MKTNKLIILLTAIALVFIWGCEKDVMSAKDQEVTVRAKGGNPGPPGGDGNGDSDGDILYQVEYHGDYFNSITYAIKKRSNKQVDQLDPSICGGFVMGHPVGLFCVPKDLVECAMGTHITARKVNNPGNGEGLVAVVEYWGGNQQCPWRVLSLETDWQPGFDLFPAAKRTYQFTNWRFGGGRFLCSPNGEVEEGRFGEEGYLFQYVTITNLGSIDCSDITEWPDGCNWPDPCNL